MNPHLEPYTVYSYKSARQLFTVVMCLVICIIGVGGLIVMMTDSSSTGTMHSASAPNASLIPKSPSSLPSNSSPLWPWMIGVVLFSLVGLIGFFYSLLAFVNSKVMVGEGHVMCFDWAGRVRLNARLEDVTTDLYNSSKGVRSCDMTTASAKFSFNNNIENYEGLAGRLRSKGKAGYTSFMETAFK